MTHRFRSDEAKYRVLLDVQCAAALMLKTLQFQQYNWVEQQELTMKLMLCLALVTSLSVVANAEIAGDWMGVLSLPRQTVHLVLHISGPDSELKATRDNPDQKIFMAIPFLPSRFPAQSSSSHSTSSESPMRAT